MGHSEKVCSVCFSGDGKLLASCSVDKTIILWNIDMGKASKILKGHSGDVKNVCFYPDSNMLVSASLDKSIRVWNTEALNHT